MKWEALLREFANKPLFHSSMLRIFEDNPAHIEVQLSRWSRSGKLLRIRRGWYLVEAPFRTREVPDASIANTVVQPSYLSLEWALGFHGLIPEAVFNPTSVTTARGMKFTASGRSYFYHHVRPGFFTGYEKVERSGDVFIVAAPEKALLDKLYIIMRGGEFSESWLEGMRFQNLEMFDLAKFRALAALVKKPGFGAAAGAVETYIRKDRER